MSGFQLILSSDTIEQGRIKINNAFSATTGLWSGSTGTQSLIHNNETGNLAIGYYAIASGSGTTANGLISFASNKDTIAYGNFSHAEGDGTYAGGLTSHAEGFDTTASGDYSHSEGGSTTAFGENSHAEGYRSYASGNTSHAEGGVTTSVGIYSHSEGVQTIAYGANSHAEGENSIATGDTSHAEGYQTIAAGNYSHAEGYNSYATGDTSHAEGFRTRAWGDYSHSEGYFTTARGIHSHAEGENSIATGDTSHAEGFRTSAFGFISHAEGFITIASGTTSHAEGSYTVAGGQNSHTGGEGVSIARVIANGRASFAHFRRTSTTSTIGVFGPDSVILGGTNHSIDSTSDSNVIIGGNANDINVVSSSSGIFAGDLNTVSSGALSSILGGYNNSIDSSSSSAIIGGDTNFIDNNSLNSGVIGGNNNYINGNNNTVIIGGQFTNTNGISSDNDSLIMGWATSGPSSTTNKTIKLKANGGVGVFEGGTLLGPADYAEYFEWVDSNPLNEKRFGYFVSLIEDKIEIGNINVIGIISSKPAIIGDASPFKWSEMYQKDEWGIEILKKFSKYSLKINEENIINIFIDEKNNIYSELPSVKNLTGELYTKSIENKLFIEDIYEKILNPSYDYKNEYISREDRPEWSPVGLLGKLRVRTSEKITSKKVSADKNGMAINGSDYHVLKTIKEFDGDYGIVQVLFK
jgi:hypothetical protein